MRDERGFLLLEVLVAFVIAALALAVLYGGDLDGLNASRRAERGEEALARARSRLTATCQGARLAASTQSGDDGSGFRWRTQVTAADSALVPRGADYDPRPPIRLRLFRVTVSVTWDGTIRPHGVTLDTKCLATEPAGAAGGEP